MVHFYYHPDRFQVYQVKSLLDAAGVPCFIKNEFIQGAMGEVSPLDCEPELWLNDAEWQIKATQVLESFKAEQQALSQGDKNDWACRSCGEINEYQFALCWQCQSVRV
ncbi:DUF2007 domain-containing protein [Glaciecola sp. MH2013]|uniref:putative signal transducing protein n=1 Tax=Glaciecola sp. MH2013 TaxID=2785524 RepID=UPI0018A0A8E4|nr:DUF2007 domain-containing protein [Glaciecola sp. MH2013]MBF7071999.1 DUF2007 domain-containing protein [Glaciecola sp. MH2013]